MYPFPKELPTNSEIADKLQQSWYYHWKGCADSETVKQFKKIGDALPVQEAQLGSLDNAVNDKKTRISEISWIHRNSTTNHLFDFITERTDRINFWNFGFRLIGMEALQYTRYPINGHYQYHNDVILNKTKDCRKLSISLCLSNADDYKGGELLLSPHAAAATSIKLGFGDMVAFPSFLPHKVSPITEGERITVVTWLYGPKFV